MELFKSIKNFLKNNNASTADTSSKSILQKQILRALMILGAIAIIGLLIVKVEFGTKEISNTDRSQHNGIGDKAKKIKVEVASKALDPDRMWRNHFEEKLSETQVTTNEQLRKIVESIDAKSRETLSETKDDMKDLREQLAIARRQLEEAADDMRALTSAMQTTSQDNNMIPYEMNLESYQIEDEASIEVPRDIKMYIPETSYIEGTLLAGIAVSTSVGSSSEPVPVVVRVTGKGNLPNNFSAKLNHCRVLGSSYGDISSERAVIRAESLVCINKDTDEVITTKIAGTIYGDDGMNGIKGKIIDRSTKNMKNAAMGGLLSGFAGTMKSEGQFTLSSVGAVNTTKQGFDGRLKDNALSGMGTAAEKIADYYIKQAENMSPVLLVPGGTRVDIVFTKGVYLGSSDVVKKIEQDRKKQREEIR